MTPRPDHQRYEQSNRVTRHLPPALRMTNHNLRLDPDRFPTVWSKPGVQSSVFDNFLLGQGKPWPTVNPANVRYWPQSARWSSVQNGWLTALPNARYCRIEDDRLGVPTLQIDPSLGIGFTG